MKKLFLSLVAATMASWCFAQNNLVATLTHGDKVTTFYGAGALNNAHDAAVAGDIITLSSGNFYATTITKPVTIRGAGGWSTYIVYKDYKTQSLGISLSDPQEGSVYMENICCSTGTYFSGTSNNTTLYKCNFQGSVNFYNSSNHHNIQFLHCRFDGGLSAYTNANCDVKMAHSFFFRPFSNYNGSSTFQFLNCVVSGRLSYFSKSTFINSVILGSDANGRNLPAETIAMNCVAFNLDGQNSETNSPYYNMQGNQVDCWISSSKEFFSGDGSYRLSEEAKTKYLGTDGKEVGIYGGQYPFDDNWTVRYPLITKLNVAKQSTADDKLSVEIEVSAVE